LVPIGTWPRISKMKIKDILEYDYPEHKVRDVKRLPRQYKADIGTPGVMRRDPKVKHKGTGAFASTYSHEDRPHDVRRVTKQQDRPDGFRKYYEQLQKHDDKDNPYFPQFSEGTTYRKGKKSVLSLQTQRLRRLEELTKHEAESVLERWFGENFDYIVWNKIFQFGAPHGVGSSKEKGWGATVIAGVLRRIIEDSWVRDYVKDKELKRALDFIKYKVVASDHIDWDLGISNIMYKRSPYGIQIVLTDPVA
jgi:hypothetical protein